LWTCEGLRAAWLGNSSDFVAWRTCAPSRGESSAYVRGGLEWKSGLHFGAPHLTVARLFAVYLTLFGVMLVSSLRVVLWGWGFISFLEENLGTGPSFDRSIQIGRSRKDVCEPAAGGGHLAVHPGAPRQQGGSKLGVGQRLSGLRGLLRPLPPFFLVGSPVEVRLFGLT